LNCISHLSLFDPSFSPSAATCRCVTALASYSHSHTMPWARDTQILISTRIQISVRRHEGPLLMFNLPCHFRGAPSTDRATLYPHYIKQAFYCTRLTDRPADVGSWSNIIHPTTQKPPKATGRLASSNSNPPEGLDCFSAANLRCATRRNKRFVPEVKKGEKVKQVRGYERTVCT